MHSFALFSVLACLATGAAALPAGNAARAETVVAANPQVLTSVARPAAVTTRPVSPDYILALVHGAGGVTAVAGGPAMVTTVVAGGVTTTVAATPHPVTTSVVVGGDLVATTIAALVPVSTISIGSPDHPCSIAAAGGNTIATVIAGGSTNTIVAMPGATGGACSIAYVDAAGATYTVDAGGMTHTHAAVSTTTANGPVATVYAA
ncbi:uncharacterized protein MKK02DRAFT_38120 [Dioszegia hungarica]|uniref:Uncharacterized protein n=1 Tax=Dioszegia hungarica TaxID=4972 RepID=A0AA38H2I1_9TREE|nr:uncharacterized protein MKK02DRAFT_38120 [Dioszegia hungarica]KAI9633467.1 hypothetical protein MKK02DRAFT_38120 [Dioszegia hungarica]